MSLQQIEQLNQDLDRTLEALERSTRTTSSEGPYIVVDSDDMSLTLGVAETDRGRQMHSQYRRGSLPRSHSADARDGFRQSHRVTFSNPNYNQERESTGPEPISCSTPSGTWNGDRPRTSFGTEEYRNRSEENSGLPRFYRPEEEPPRWTPEQPEQYRLSPVSVPKFKTGNDWRCFLTEFCEMVELTRMRPTLQLVHLKQAIPEDAKRILYQYKVTTIDQALKILTDLYEPKCDSWTALQDLQKIVQSPGERLRVLAGRIQDAARKYAETVHMTELDLEQMTKDRFKHAVANEETRDHLLWEQTEMTLEAMIQRAQRFEDSRRSGSKQVQKAFRTVEQNPEKDKLEQEITELKRRLEELQRNKEYRQNRKPSFQCWNCGEKGHYARKCQKEKLGDGFTYRPKKTNQMKRQKQRVSGTQTEQSLN